MPFALIVVVIAVIFGGVPLVKHLKGIDLVAAAESRARDISYEQALANTKATASGWQNAYLPMTLSQTYKCKSQSGLELRLRRTPYVDGREAVIEVGHYSARVELAPSPKFVRTEFDSALLMAGRGYFYQTAGIEGFGVDGYFRGTTMAFYPEAKTVLVTAGDRPRTDEVVVFSGCELR